MALIPEVRRCCTSIGEEDAHNAHRTDSLLLALSQGKAPRPRTPPGSLSLSLFVCLSLLLALGQKARGLHARVRTGLAVCVTLLSSLLTSLHRSVCLVRTQPSLYFSPLPGLIAALSFAKSLVPPRTLSPCRPYGYDLAPLARTLQQQD